jgi:hypothetical protein
VNTGERFIEYLDKLDAHDKESEVKIMDNYEKEFEKVDTVSKIIIQMINDYKDSL